MQFYRLKLSQYFRKPSEPFRENINVKADFLTMQQNLI